MEPTGSCAPSGATRQHTALLHHITVALLTQSYIALKRDAMRGETTYLAYQLINNEISRCVPGAKQVILPNVNHDGPIRDPEGFTSAIFEFLSNQSR